LLRAGFLFRNYLVVSSSFFGSGVVGGVVGTSVDFDDDAFDAFGDHRKIVIKLLIIGIT
jgi:hypothetical protein